MIVEVACPIPIPKNFDYALPVSTPASDVASLVGRRVTIPFGFKTSTGIVCAVKESSDAPARALKTVGAFIDAEPILDASMMALGRWLADTYACSLGEALFALLPPGAAKSQAFKDADSGVIGNSEPVFLKPSFEMTPEQAAAMGTLHEAIYSDGCRHFLLFGVAAAGKTEVYVSAIKDAIGKGRSALYLTAEIGLAIQTADILKARFGDEAVLLWHSDIPVKQRADFWRRCRNGEFSVVVGSRSAALLPMPNLGVIVVDEEHDPFYKEERKPRFHVRDVAWRRAEQQGAVAIFGSATPSLEMYQAFREGRVEMLELPERAVSAATPRVHLVDMRREKSPVFSQALRIGIERRLAAHEQVILFLNRRGFHRYVLCPQCKWVARCPTCGIALVHHKSAKSKAGLTAADAPDVSPGFPLRGTFPGAQDAGGIRRARPGRGGAPEKWQPEGLPLTCHYCSYAAGAPAACPQCGHKKLFSGGYGTQRLQEEIQKDFPWATVLRWDVDATKKRGDQDRIYHEMNAGKADVLIGTQIVAQGLNFPRVTLVVVVDADVSLHLPDFRAAERTFQVVTQVAGRAGRDMVTGDVIIQTKNSDHYALQCAARMDYRAFADDELRFRDDLNYPPFTRLIEIRCEASVTEKAFSEISCLADWLSKLEIEPPLGLLGPTKSQGRARGKKGFQLLLKVRKENFDDVLRRLKEHLGSHISRFRIEVDPV